MTHRYNQGWSIKKLSRGINQKKQTIKKTLTQIGWGSRSYSSFFFSTIITSFCFVFITYNGMQKTLYPRSVLA